MVETIKEFLNITSNNYDMFIIIICLFMITMFFESLMHLFVFIFKWVGGIR